MMQNALNPFVICKAAAGSGKTFTLVKEYLKLAMSVEGVRGTAEFRRRLRSQFRGILAITFTNKAAGEMKSRVLDSLAEISAHGIDADLSPMGGALLKALNEQPCYASNPLTENDLMDMAAEVHSAVLHQYSDLSVCTIDSFMHRIVRTFAHDLNRPVNFEVMIDQDEMVTQAVDGLMSMVGTAGNESLTALMQAFADSRMEEEKGYRLEGALASLASQLFKEGTDSYVEALSKMDLNDFTEIHRSLTADNRRFEQEVRSCGEAMMEVLGQVGADEADCAGGAKGYYGYFRSLVRGDVRAMTKSAAEQLESGKLSSAKCDPGLREDLQEAATIIRDIYLRTRALVGVAEGGTEQDGQGLRDYNTRSLLLKNLYSMALLGKLSEQLNLYAKDNEVVHLSEFNRMINKIVCEEPAPFIYERLGNRYHHFLIDEFQDTSVLQWHNLVPLVENGVSQGAESLVVGDGKQAIYRFRQGDVRQFVSLPRVEGMALHGQTLAAEGNSSQVNLDTNYRTASSVVEFNNRFFTWLLQQKPFADNALAQQIYVGAASGEPELTQRLPEGTIPVGHVEVAFTDPKEPEEVYEYIRQAIVRLVTQQGYRQKDIMILGRNKADLEHVSTYLQSHPEDLRIELTSSESFFLTRSHAVMAVVAALRCLYDSSDRVAAADLLQRLASLGIISDSRRDAFLEEGAVDVASLMEELDFKPHYLMGLSLYDCCEALVRGLHLDGIDTAYVASLLGHVADFSVRRGEGLGPFLEWFDENAGDPDDSHTKQLSVATPEGVDAVQMMTIHKAKGLEAPVVICPFFPPRWKPYRLWVDLDEGFEAGGKRLPAAFVEMDKKRSSQFDAVRDEEQRMDEVDKLNVLYVALTRPKEQLIIVCPTPPERPSSDEVSYPRLLKAFMDECAPDLGEADFHHVESRRKGKTAEREALEHLSFAEWSKRVKVASPSERSLEPLAEDKVRFGTYAHDLLSRVRHAGDVEEAVEQFARQTPLADEERERLKALAYSVVTHPGTARFFRAEYGVKNECDLTDGLALGRPDRVVFTPDETWVVDFKTGRDEGDVHDRQVRRYCQAISAMGYPQVSGWLIYLLPDIRVRQVL